MGIFSKLSKFTGIGNLADGLRTGATAAARDAKAAGELSLAEQQALRAEIGGIYNPMIEKGNQAFNSLAGFYGGDQQAIIDQAQASPFMSSLVSSGEDAIARNAQSTGGWRTGTSQENLAQNSQNVLSGLVNQILQGKSQIAQSGFGATDAYTTAMQNIIAGTGATRGEIANIGINQAAQRGNQIAGGVGALAQVGGSLFSDKRLKDNIKEIGEKNGFKWYSWLWNELASGIGLTGESEGHIAQEVQEKRPDLITEKDGYLAINYGGF